MNISTERPDLAWEGVKTEISTEYQATRQEHGRVTYCLVDGVRHKLFVDMAEATTLYLRNQMSGPQFKEIRDGLMNAAEIERHNRGHYALFYEDTVNHASTAYLQSIQRYKYPNHG